MCHDRVNKLLVRVSMRSTSTLFTNHIKNKYHVTRTEPNNNNRIQKLMLCECEHIDWEWVNTYNAKANKELHMIRSKLCKTAKHLCCTKQSAHTHTYVRQSPLYYYTHTHRHTQIPFYFFVCSHTKTNYIILHGFFFFAMNICVKNKRWAKIPQLHDKQVNF